ncbi:MAG: WYL domain-containing protein [Actinobacteria bacterium]|nr:WYL domain-containing protein [Actinomycetota bacterium]
MAEDRFERLANLVTLLLDARHGATYAEIVQAVPGYPQGDDARRRAFERDKRLLRDEDIPLQEKEGRYRIPPEEYFLPDLQLSDDEHVALQLAMAAVPVGGDQGGWALRKLRLGGPGGKSDQGALTLLADLDEHPHLPTLHSAIRRRATVTFSHRPGRPPEREAPTRTVEPIRLLFRDGHWYLQGFDRLRQALRNFRVDRIQGDVEVGPAGTSSPRAPSPEESPEMPREPWLLGTEQPEPAVVRVDSVLASKALADVGPSASVERHPDGSLTITLPVVQRAAFRSWVLGFLDHAVVLGPPDLRAELVGWLSAVAGAGDS